MPQIIWEYWLTASDERVCRSCAARDGLLFRQGEGPQPPVHPFCRCRREEAFVQVVDDPDSLPGQGGKPVPVEDLIPDTPSAPPPAILPEPGPQPPRWPPIFWWPEPYERPPDLEEEEEEEQP
jgi:hypothetical protein